MGLWEPTRFLKEFGGGIYMLKPYDPERVPVIFVNGAGGNPLNWRFFFDRLDKTRYQAWFPLYPSGMRIDGLGRSLNTLLRKAAKKYDISRLFIVAHSMGGLVSREALQNHISDGEPQLVKEFITLSTPWNGHRMAEKGVDALDTPVPAWHDVVPGSHFLQTVFKAPLKGKVNHHLLFGYLVSTEEDGSVALDSVLVEEAQDDAVELRAFEADHVGILFSDDVFDYVERILDSAISETAETGTPVCAPDTADEPASTDDEVSGRPGAEAGDASK